MTYIDVVKYCLTFPNAHRQVLSQSGNVFALMVNNETFGQFETGAPVQWQFSLRVTPEDFEALPNPPHIRQADTQARDYWITIRRVENFDEQQLKKLIEWSYRKAQAS